MKQEPDKLPGELFFDGHGCGLRLLGLFFGLGNPILILIFFFGVPVVVIHELLLGSICIFASVIFFFFLTFPVHQVRINVRARTYSLQEGFWPFYRTFIGTLDDVEIHLTTEVVPGVARAPFCSFWVKAYLVWKDNGEPNLLLWSEHDHNRAALEAKIPDAEARARDLAARLQVPVRIELGSRGIKRDIPNTRG